ncbi:UNVERIFIED_CONTAM: hypothetical protein Sradi_1909700 [Sesamum radiatum]|uniref:Uncharacterized protein n=1 Tax=Sesamum radiatum TaxID=300843 RepID=A0AAW2TY41_SESRA
MPETTEQQQRTSTVVSRLCGPERATASGRKRGRVFGLDSKAHHMNVGPSQPNRPTAPTPSPPQPQRPGLDDQLPNLCTAQLYGFNLFDRWAFHCDIEIPFNISGYPVGLRTFVVTLAQFNINNNHNKYMPPHTVRERLDRPCSSISWSLLFPEARVFHADSPYSDHALLIIDLQPKVQWDLSGCKKYFRFEAAWLLETECETIITKAWSISISQRAELLHSEILAFVSSRLSCWGRLYGHEVRERINELECLLVARNKAERTSENRSRAWQEKAELTKLILQEEFFWK